MFDMNVKCILSTPQAMAKKKKKDGTLHTFHI